MKLMQAHYKQLTKKEKTINTFPPCDTFIRKALSAPYNTIFNKKPHTCYYQRISSHYLLD